MIEVLSWTLVAIGLAMTGGTLISFSSHPHWFVRGWDFPRFHILLLSGGSAIGYLAIGWTGDWWEWPYVGATCATAAWQSYKILPYTRLHPVRVKATDTAPDNGSFRLVISNVLMQNKEYERFLKVIQKEDPDVVLTVEVNQQWVSHLKPLEDTHPFVVQQPQENMYGMALYSRFPLVEPKVRFRVQNDVPSIETDIVLPSGIHIRLHGLHPRPPEPLRDQDAAPRDAELVIVGKEIEHEDRPTLVAGDLNDVAWSATTELFLRISGLLDPRIGRGFFNSFSANSRVFRFPLDHVFHSNCFLLHELRRLEYVGSDHFPVLIALRYESIAKVEQPETKKEAGDESKAREKVERVQDTA